jgi:hypothetical protein
MRRDLQAVFSGLTMEHNSGAVEGNVTHLRERPQFRKPREP